MKGCLVITVFSEANRKSKTHISNIIHINTKKYPLPDFARKSATLVIFALYNLHILF